MKSKRGIEKLYLYILYVTKNYLNHKKKIRHFTYVHENYKLIILVVIISYRMSPNIFQWRLC